MHACCMRKWTIKRHHRNGPLTEAAVTDSIRNTRGAEKLREKSKAEQKKSQKNKTKIAHGKKADEAKKLKRAVAHCDHLDSAKSEQV